MKADPWCDLPWPPGSREAADLASRLTAERKAGARPDTRHTPLRSCQVAHSRVASLNGQIPPAGASTCNQACNSEQGGLMLDTPPTTGNWRQTEGSC